jgi:hypothetical protein
MKLKCFRVELTTRAVAMRNRSSEEERKSFFMTYLTWVVAMLLACLTSSAQEVKTNSVAPDCTPGSVTQLSPKSQESVAKFLGALQLALNATDKERVASLVHYPLKVGSVKGTYTVSSKSAFVKRYDEIISPDIIRVVASLRPECADIMSQGFMFGQGTIWFNSFDRMGFRIITINPPIPRAGQ